MKVVLFTGGKSLRLPGQSEEVPKPMITVGYRPILWHVMRFYSHWNYRDFLLCLGYKADTVSWVRSLSRVGNPVEWQFRHTPRSPHSR